MSGGWEHVIMRKLWLKNKKLIIGDGKATQCTKCPCTLDLCDLTLSNAGGDEGYAADIPLDESTRRYAYRDSVCQLLRQGPLGDLYQPDDGNSIRNHHRRGDFGDCSIRFRLHRYRQRSGISASECSGGDDHRSRYRDPKLPRYDRYCMEFKSCVLLSVR